MPVTPNKDEVEGKWEKAKGYVKDKAGEATGNKKLESRGEAQRAAGRTQESWGKVKHKVGNALEDIADSVNN